MKTKFKIGDVVTCKQRVEAYYSNYGGAPECWFEAGDVGVIGAVDVPCVHKNTKHSYFYCIDFLKPGVPYQERFPDCPWRVSLYDDNVVRLPDQLPSSTKLPI